MGEETWRPATQPPERAAAAHPPAMPRPPKPAAAWHPHALPDTLLALPHSQALMAVQPLAPPLHPPGPKRNGLTFSLYATYIWLLTISHRRGLVPSGCQAVRLG